VPDWMTAFEGATSDLLDDLNRKMTRRQRRAGIRYLNAHFKANGHTAQTPLDLKRPIYVIIARFDPSKGMDLGLDAWMKAWLKLEELGVPLSKRPQLVIVGNGSVDDPAGPVILQEIMDQAAKMPARVRNDAKIARVPHNDLAINALLWLAILALQTSTKEGFENRVTDALLHAVFVLGSTAGGIPLQILEGLTGYKIDPWDTDEWVRRMVEIALESRWNRFLRKQRVKKWTKRHNHQYTTIANAISLLFISWKLATDPDFQGNGMTIYEEAMKAE
jgi:alpha,alpha-trehalose phosphorylase (configuration-retaining)